MRRGSAFQFPLTLLLLPVLMLLAQQGAWLHQLSHAAYSAHVRQVQAIGSAHFLDNEQCPTCQSFSEVSFTASPELPELAFLASSFLRSAEQPFIVLGVDRPTPRSRGPPSV